MKIIQFEWKKLWRLKVYPVFLLVTLLFVSNLFFYNYLMQDQITTKKVEHFTRLRQDISQQIFMLEDQLQTKADPVLEAQLSMAEELSNGLQELISSIYANLWREELQNEITVYETALRYIEFENAYFGVSKMDMQNIIRLNEELLKRNLPKEDLDLSIQPAIFMKKIVSIIMTPIGFILLAFVVGIVVTKELDEFSIRQVFTLPISRGYYVTGKYISLFIASIPWLFTVFGSAYLLGVLFGRNEGDIFNYPLYTKLDTFITTGEYLIQSIVYSLCFIAFLLSILLLSAYVFKNTIITYSFLLIFLAGGWMLSNYGLHVVWNPFTFQMVDRVIIDSPSFYPIGTIVLLVAGIISSFAAMTIIRKRGM